MTAHKHSRLIDALCIFAMLGVSACSEQEEIADAPTLLSDKEITLSLPGWIPIQQSRAAIYDDSGNLLDRSKGGGYLTLYAYFTGTTTKYIDGIKTFYFDDTDNPDDWRWIMLDGNDARITYYWPNSDKLNFFAYMPNTGYSDPKYKPQKTYVTVEGYSTEEGQKFSCDLPHTINTKTDKTAKTEIQEFVYAYETEKDKSANPLTLNFKHPFALINFRLKGGSYRMTVHDITFDKLYLQGTFTTESGQWTPMGSKQTYKAEIGKRIPNDINYNSNLSEWFIVMPQDLKGVNMTLSATRSADKTHAESTVPDVNETFTFTEGDKWEPGKKYTYIISYGDNKEEIYFNVLVEDWISTGVNGQEIEVK